MATKKPTAKKTAKPAAKNAAPKAKPVSIQVKPIKAALTKSGLVSQLAEQTGVEAKSVKLVLSALEASVLGSMHKNGAGEFTLPGLLKVTAQKIAAKPKRFGKNPFTGQEQWFAAKPATVRVKVRPLKKLKDAPL